MKEIEETKAFKKFLERKLKHIDEDDFINLRNACLIEAFGDYVPTSMADAYHYFHPKNKEFQKLVEKSGTSIRWKSFFEDRLRDYLEKEGPNPEKTPFKRLEWFSKKRKELEKLLESE